MSAAYNTNPLRMFSFTVNGESLAIEGFLNSCKTGGLPPPITYLKAAKEEGGDTANVHYHVFLRASEGQRYSYYTELLQAVLIDCKIVNVKQTIDYIGNIDFEYSPNHPDKKKRGKAKGGKVLMVWELGDVNTVKIPRAKSAGNDIDSRLDKLQDLIKDGEDIAALYEADFGCMIRYGRAIESYVAIHYGTYKIGQDMAALKEMAAKREKESVYGENKALMDMIMRLQDRIISLEK